MGEIIIKNQTSLTDLEAVLRVALYFADAKDVVEEDGFHFTKETIAGRNVIVIVEG